MGNVKHIVVLGGGYGGILTAKKLEKKLRKRHDICLTLIDRNSYHTMLTELHEVAAGRVPVDAIRIDFEKVFAGRKINVVLDDIQDIDFDNRELKGEVSCYHYDYLVIGTGSQPTFYGTAGAEAYAFTLWSYEDAVKIKQHIMRAFAEASVETNPDIRARLLTFVVIGCGFTGIEMIGELAEWRSRLCRTFNIDEAEVRLIIADLIPKVLPAFKESLADKTVRRLTKMNVEIMLNSPIENVQENYIDIAGKGRIATETVIWAAGVEGSEILNKVEDESLEKLARNRIQTDQYLRAVGNEHIFVVGDNIFYIPEGEERPVPQMVENAEHSSALVAKNLIATINNGTLKPYKPTFHGAMVSIGGRYGVAQVGSGKNQFVFSGFMAMLIKHVVNFVYFLQIAGFNKLWTYWMHEFFYVPDRRSFLGGHFAKASPNFWLVPLRLFVGFKWFWEGLTKLPSILLNPNTIFLIPKKAVDGVSAASEAWVDYDAIAKQIAESPYPGFFKDFMTNVLITEPQKANEAVNAIPVPPFVSGVVDWFMNLFFYTAEGGYTFLATLFQVAIVVAEIGIGLALFAGLFTAPAAVLSIALGVMIWTSGMAPPEMLWYLAAGVAVIGGSGSTFGLDYYLLPRLKRQWKRLPFVKKWYLYTDDI